MRNCMLGGNNHLFSNDNPATTLRGLGFKNKDIALQSIQKIEEVFSRLRDKQKINTCSPKFLRPRYLLDSEAIIEKYYLHQKMYRVLALLNRANTVKYRYPKEGIIEAIEVFRQWMKEYHILIQKYAHVHYSKCYF